MEVLIQGTISALGYLEDGVYYQEPDCYETVRDLIRFLRTDSNVLLARKLCGEHNIIENDLIPIIKSENLKDNMFDIVLRLLANLTQPAIVSMQGKQPEDRDEWQTYWILEENLRRAKLAFADVKFFTVLKEKLEKYFVDTEWDDRLEEERLVMERIIVLLRYIFSISPTERDGRRTAAESNSHDRVITAFLDSGIDKVLTNIATQSKEQEFHLSIMIIFALILQEHKPADIVSAGRTRTQAEKEQAEEELRQVVEAEKAKLAAQRRKILASRHSRFSGSYLVKGLSAVNKEKDFVVLKPIKDVNELSFQAERKHKKIVAKNRRPFDAEVKTHLSSLDLRLKLKQFLEGDLSKCFNRLMKSSKEMAFDTRLSAGQRSADMYFFLLMRFMLEYTRLAGLPSSKVSVCLPVESFHHIQVHLDNYLESAAALHKEAKSFGLRAQHALSAYKELILFHQHLLDKGSPEEKEFAKRTCNHILTVEEYREMGFVLIRKYKPGFLSKTFLRELILATHYYFRLLERSVKAGQLTTVTKRSKIRRATARRKKTAENAFCPEPLPAVVDGMSAEDMEKKWPQIADEIKDIILGNKEPSVDQIPINSLLDVQEEQHQKFAMLKIQRALRERRAKDAMGLYRASRAMWPNDGIFGDPTNSADQQIEEIREIFFTDLKEIADELLKAEIEAQKKFTDDSMIDNGSEEDPYSSDDDEEEPRYETKEVKFDLQEYVAFYARTDVLRWYVFLLNDFASNSQEVNKALVKLLHRVAFDLKMPVRLYQLSLFRIFAEVRKHFDGLTLEEMKKNPLFDIYNFGYHLLKRFFACYEKNGAKLAPEILFWKGPKECYEIENGDGYEESKHQKDAYSWSEELENELRSLYNEYRDMDERPEGMDVLDFIEPNLSRPRTRKQILKKMKEFALDPLGAKANKGSIMDRNFPIIRAKELIEQYNALPQKDDDMIDFVRTNLAETHGEFSRQKIIKQISYLGIVYEKKRPVSKNYKWSDGLRTELAALKEQYYEMDAEDQELVDVVNYCARRLSEKKPKRQIKQELIALGAPLEPDEKRKRTIRKPSSPSASTSKENDEVESRSPSPSGSERPGSLGKGRDIGSSDAELELEEESVCSQSETGDQDHHEEDRDIVSERNGEATAQHEGRLHLEGSQVEGPSEKSDAAERIDRVSPSKSDSDRSRRIKRRRMISSSDEEDNAAGAAIEENDIDEPDEPAPKSPIVSQTKRKRIVTSDSDED